MGCLLIVTAAAFGQSTSVDPSRWTASQLKQMESLALSRLAPIAHDPSNRYAGQPAAADLGHALFFDPKLSAAGTVSCATCHDPERSFTDGLARSRGVGTTARGAPTLIGIAYSPWFYWDGRRDSLWSQALSPLEGRDEMAGSRVEQVQYVLSRPDYAQLYGAAFGESPDLTDRDRFKVDATPFGSPAQRAAWDSMQAADRELINQLFANLGKAFAAYERKLRPAPSRFDDYVTRLTRPQIETVLEEAILTEDEISGLQLFLSSRTNCMRCHNGPLFSNHGFHNIGSVPRTASHPDLGRQAGAKIVMADRFNCLGSYSDAQPQQCAELRFLKRSGQELLGAFKVPTLRNVADTAPYFHDGSARSLDEVLEHYTAATPGLGHQELTAIRLTAREKELVIKFLATLSSSVDAESKWLRAPDRSHSDKAAAN